MFSIIDVCEMLYCLVDHILFVFVVKRDALLALTTASIAPIIAPVTVPASEASLISGHDMVYARIHFHS